MGMDDAAHLRPVFVDVEMMRQIHRGLPSPLNFATFKVSHGQICRAQLFIIHAARLDDHQATPPVNAAGIAAMHGHQPGAVNAQVCFPDFAPQLFDG